MRDSAPPAASTPSRTSSTAGALDRSEIVQLGLLLAALFAAFQWHLRDVLVTDMDEGTYLYAGELVAHGLVPYRDFLLAHPPLVAWLASGWFRLVGPGVMGAREAYLVVILAATLPLYALVRKLSASPKAALLTVASYMAGALVLSNMGRTVRLEPLMNAFVIGAFAIWVLRPTSPGWLVVMGIAAGAGMAVKVNAAIPLAVLALGDLVWNRPVTRVIVRWLWVALGLALVLVPVLGWCLSQPGFVAAVFESQVHRPRIGLSLRVLYLIQNFERFPPILLGLAASVWFLARPNENKSLKVLALVALGNTLLLFLVFKTFFSYYIVQVLPWIACLFAVGSDRLAAQRFPAAWPTACYGLLGLFAVLVPIGYGETYYRKGAAHVAEPRAILPLIDRDRGYLYSMYPAFALWSGRRLYPWYYRADSLVARINHWIGDADFTKAFSGAGTLVLEQGELGDYPGARAYVSAHFRQVYSGEYWVVWQRSDDPPPAR